MKRDSYDPRFMVHVLAAPELTGYALIDSGAGEKLERFGEVTLRRPDPQALWRKGRPDTVWDSADLTFVRESDRGGSWCSREDAPRCARGDDPEWAIEHEGARFLIRPTPFKHVGLFPEQVANWSLVQEAGQALGLREPRMLNLFGYTGAASVLAARSGFAVTHVDASKTSITWAVDNAEASGLGRSALRVVCEDALRFARRAARRGSEYEVILLDPPHYGRGPKGEVWRLEEHLAELIETAETIAADDALIVLSTYAVGYSPLAFARMLEGLDQGSAETRVEAGELAIPERSFAGPNAPERLLPAGFCARWARGAAVPLLGR